MFRKLLLALMALAGFTISLPLEIRQTTTLKLPGLLAIAPNSQTCATAPFPTECRTAEQSLPYILASFKTYNIKSPAVQAALISLMAYESGDFVYNQNHFPGVPGQGTRNMQSPTYNALYATYLGFENSPTGAELIAAVGDDEYTFASAAWFLITQCGFAVMENMSGGSRAAWEAYLTGCVGTTVDTGRVAYWERAIAALGVPIRA